MFQQAGGGLVAALADEHWVHTVVVVLVHLLQNLGQHAGLAAGLEVEVDLTIGGAAAQYTHVQAACDKAHHLADAAVLGQVVKAGQGKQDVGAFGELFQRKADVLKCLALADKLIGQLGRTGQRTGAAEGVQNEDLLFGVFFQHHGPGGHGGVIAAGKIAADGQRNAVIGLQKILGPFFRAGAGSGAGAVVVGHGLQHLGHIQGGQVHIFALTHTNLERYKGKLHPGTGVLQLPDLAGAVTYDHPRHRQKPPFLWLVISIYYYRRYRQFRQGGSVPLV